MRAYADVSRKPRAAASSSGSGDCIHVATMASRDLPHRVTASGCANTRIKRECEREG
jgi:hypothetical protein